MLARDRVASKMVEDSGRGAEVPMAREVTPWALQSLSGVHLESGAEGPGDTPVTFLDVAACFSSEEWKLLHRWQKELYENVMKEIHHALFSLGPVIATSIFSLTPNENQDLTSTEHQEPDRRDEVHVSSSEKIANSNVLSKKRKKEKQYLKNSQNAAQRECSDLQSSGPEELMGHLHYSGYPGLNTDNDLRMEHDLDSSLMDHYGVQVRGNSSMQGSGFPFSSTEGEPPLMDYCDAEDSDIGFNSRPEVNTRVASLGINEDGETYPIDIQNYEQKEIRTSGSGDRATKSKVGDGGKYTVKNIESKASSGKVKVNKLPKLEMETNTASQLWSESNPKNEQEKVRYYPTHLRTSWMRMMTGDEDLLELKVKWQDFGEDDDQYPEEYYLTRELAEDYHHQFSG
ncbi:hypothetical protein NDU88_001184 [Pleurodeles waltl]|uniref:KRAB domain-containing protein n=1 Tax=Pleurodeles waltl TaxID=8319 RepID=A0AAV7U671_PLEWA|nr:hypothetical protein NDU88_001184 [Pleurodeles waltl]